MTDAVEIAQSITIEAIRAGVNRPDEILNLFQTVMEKARGSPAPATIGRVEEDIRPQPEVAEEPERLEPAAEPEPQPVVAKAPLPSKAWREPKVTSPPPPPPPDEAPAARLSPEDIAASHGEEFIKCLECGQTKQQIKGHLTKMHNMSIGDYKAKWGLPDDYPVVAPATRRRFQERAKSGYEKAKQEGRGLAVYDGPRTKKTA